MGTKYGFTGIRTESRGNYTLLAIYSCLSTFFMGPLVRLVLRTTQLENDSMAQVEQVLDNMYIYVYIIRRDPHSFILK